MKEIFCRKQELIKRDPVYRDLCKIFNRIIDARINNKGDLLLRYRVGDPIFEEVQNFASKDISGEDKKKHELKYPDHWELLRLEGEIAYKWHVHLEFDFATGKISINSYTNDEVIWIGSPPFKTYTTDNASIHYPNLKWHPYPNPFNKKPLLADINEFVTPGYNYSGRWIPILIDVSRLNNSDEKKIKKLVWEIVKTNLQKEEDKAPYDEHRELTFLYKTKENKFQRYLKWYDLHCEGLPFRTIAFYDKVEKDYPGRTEEAKEKLRGKGRTKTITTVKGQRVLSDVVGVSIKGEDAVEKAIKIIYSAIHRKPCPSKLKKQTSYRCPEHKNNCPEDCNYRINWMKNFNKRTWNPTPKKLTDMGLDANIIDNSKNVSRPIKSTIKRKDSRVED